MLQFEKLLLLKQIEYSSRKLAQLSHNLSHGMRQTERSLSQGLRAFQGLPAYQVPPACQVVQASKSVRIFHQVVLQQN